MKLSSKVYCYGELLDTVQMSGIYPDSKTFVDMPMKKPENITLDSFNTFVSNYTDRKPPQADILAWVENNFDPVGSEFDAWVPTDFKDNPSFLKKIRDPQLQAFGKAVNGIWKQLGRKINTKVRDNAELYSMVYVDNPIIVPGGRFREFYYWDSYWVLQGLFKSEMFVVSNTREKYSLSFPKCFFKQTAKGMINNFVAMVKSFGFVPNGGRVYYSQRSQPPLLIPMAKTYFDNTKDKDFIASITDDLAVEFNFWVTTHSVNVNGHTLYKYGDRSSGPRPESYREDIATASNVANPADRDDLLRNIKAAAESGLDFSSKWFHNKDGTNIGDLTDLKTRSIVPVELNSFLCKNAEILAEFYGYKNDTAKQTKFTKIASDLKTVRNLLKNLCSILKLISSQAINEVFWNEKAGAWFDYDLINNKSRPYFVVTNLAPLWTESFDQKKRSHIADRVLKYISDQGLDSYEGGVPTTLYNTCKSYFSIFSLH